MAKQASKKPGKSKLAAMGVPFPAERKSVQITGPTEEGPRQRHRFHSTGDVIAHTYGPAWFARFGQPLVVSMDAEENVEFVDSVAGFCVSRIDDLDMIEAIYGKEATEGRRKRWSFSSSDNDESMEATGWFVDPTFVERAIEKEATMRAEASAG